MLELLILDEEVQASISKLKNYSEQNVISYEELVNPMTVIGENPNYLVELPMGFRVVYSVEEQPMGLCRHLSISVDNQEPSFNDLLIVIGYFGFNTDLLDGKAYRYTEKCMVNGQLCFATNVIEKL